MRKQRAHHHLRYRPDWLHRRAAGGGEAAEGAVGEERGSCGDLLGSGKVKRLMLEVLFNYSYFFRTYRLFVILN